MADPLAIPSQSTAVEVGNDFALEDYGIADVESEELRDALAVYVKDRFEEAYRHKRNTGITERLLRNLRANKCMYQPDEIALLGPFNDVYMGIEALKARAAVSWLNDIILNNIDAPFSIDATPNPELSEDQREHVIDTLLRELPTMGDVQQLRERALSLKSVALNVAKKESEEATKRMTSLITDQLYEGDWYEAFGAYIENLAVYPTAFLRGPVVVQRKTGVWNGNTFGVKNKDVTVCRTIDTFNAFPSPTSTTTQNGDYFIEKVDFSFSDIHNLIGLQGFDDKQVRECLAAYPEGFELNLFSDAERDMLEDIDQGLLTKRRSIETIIYNGRIPGQFLIDHGVLVDDPQKEYEAEVWVAGYYTLRAILNPDPLGMRPIDGTSYRKIVGSIWGQSVIDLVYDIGRICRASCRALVRNMSYSSGPMGEVVSERVADAQDPTQIEPYKIALVGPDLSGTGAPAYRFHNVGSVAGELIAVFERFLKQADDVSGIPAYVLGNPQVAGAGRTLGGLSMLMANAAKGIKNVQLNIDRDVITPYITRLFNRNMKLSKDKSIKADAQVVARGATGLLQKELSQARLTEILQLLTPYIQTWDQLPDGIKVILREVLKTTGLDVDQVIADPEQGRKAQDLLRVLGAGGQAAALNRGTSTPQILPPQSVPPLNAPLTGRPAISNGIAGV